MFDNLKIVTLFFEAHVVLSASSGLHCAVFILRDNKFLETNWRAQVVCISDVGHVNTRNVKSRGFVYTCSTNLFYNTV